MYSPRKKLDVPDDFQFPHTPYNMQQQLMKSMYAVLEKKGIGIFESPTGTGKSLTLTCAALRWLEDHECEVERDVAQHIKDIENEIERMNCDVAKATDWITGQFAMQEQRKKMQELQKLQKQLQEYNNKLNDIQERHKSERSKRRETQLKQIQNNFNEENNSLDTNESEWDQLESMESNETQEIDTIEKSQESYHNAQIFFCSRTHSQLAQVVREIKKTVYGKRIRCVSLASRQQLCIHPQLRRLTNVAQINEQCLDMARCDGKQTSKKNNQKATKCCYKAQQAVQKLSDTTLMNLLDIEELVMEGEKLKSCPYYASRAATNDAQVIMLPYQMLLHRRTRQQSGIDLKGSIVIIDEAHNLLDTILQLHSSEVSLQQLLLAQEQIFAYKMHYAKRFSTNNLLRINQLIFIIKRLIKLLQPQNANVNDKSTSAISSRMLRTFELAAEGEFFNIDIFQLLEFCNNTRFARKLQGFCSGGGGVLQAKENHMPDKKTTAAVEMLQRLQQEHECRAKKKPKTAHVNESEDEKSKQSNEGVMAAEKSRSSSTSPIYTLLAFLESLTEKSEDGRVLLNINTNTEPAQSSLKYILLNPSGHFEDIVNDARAIVIAGGTMQPTTELTQQLFRSCADRVQLHFYDHVISSQSVLPFAVARGPSGRKLCFNYTQRSSEEMLTELSMILQNICNVVPAGVICFFPSYDYLDIVYQHLQRSSVLRKIETKKTIFRETRSSDSATQTVEQLMANYAATIKNGQGALLLSVVGGKMSEGLNFADDLGRAVIVVGLPYPSRQSYELQERMKYLDTSLNIGAGNEYYENLCMKAVNQCIGRSVRHIRDYACVYLLDERYLDERIRNKLPQWIKRCLQLSNTFGASQASTARFFKEKRHVHLES